MEDLDQAANNAGVEDTDTSLALDPAEHIAQLTTERDQLVSEKSDLRDQLLRSKAEFDNYRKRVERERSDFSDYVAMEAIRPLLSVLDDFERALKAAGTMDSDPQEFVKGVELIQSRLLEALAKQGLEPIEAVGTPFDPNLHHGVQREERPDEEEGTVIEEYQRGYNFKGKLLRPAMVKVAVRG
jgi:molecular chaperone GrpE